MAQNRVEMIEVDKVEGEVKLSPYDQARVLVKEKFIDEKVVSDFMEWIDASEGFHENPSEEGSKSKEDINDKIWESFCSGVEEVGNRVLYFKIQLLTNG